MSHIIRRLLLVLVVLAAGSMVAEAAGKAESTDNNTVDVLDKLANHFYLDFRPVPNGKIELPRIFVADGELFMYSSTTAAINSGDGFTDEYYLENEPDVSSGKIKPVTYHVVKADGTYPSFDFSLSSHLVFFLFSGILVGAVAIPLKNRYNRGIGRDTEPRGVFHNMMETLVVFIRDEVTIANIGEAKYKTFAPYLLTAFFMILFMNLFGLLPWGVSSTADVTVTAAMATVTFLITQVFANKDHWKHVFWFPGVPVVIKFIMIPVEFIGLFTKPFALAIRLFANMASGKVLIFSIIGLIFIFYNLYGAALAYTTSVIWIAFALFIYVIKVVVAFLQAYIFVMLSALFIGMSTAEHEDH